MRSTCERVPNFYWEFLGVDAVKMVEEFKAEAVVDGATKTRDSAIKKDVDKKPGVSMVISDTLLPMLVTQQPLPPTKLKRLQLTSLKMSSLLRKQSALTSSTTLLPTIYFLYFLLGFL